MRKTKGRHSLKKICLTGGSINIVTKRQMNIKYRKKDVLGYETVYPSITFKRFILIELRTPLNFNTKSNKQVYE